MGQLYAVEIIYRGVFQKTLAKGICRGIVLAAHEEGKPGISFGRYGDSPERNGIPAKSFAIVASDEQTLEAGMAQYEPKQVDVAVVLDDTLCKGAESWGWYGLETVNKSVKPNGTLIVVSLQDPDSLLHAIHAKNQPYKLAVLKGVASFSGMWVYKDDHTDVRVLGAIAKALPELVNLKSIEKYIQDKLKNDLKVTSARVAFDKFATMNVQPGVGNPEEPFHFDLPGWSNLRDGVSINGLAERGGAYADPVTGQLGGFRPSRNEKFKKYTTRTMRPVVNFDTCIKCTLCWLQCPDTCFDVTPDGLYDANMQACCGCGVCEAVCPVPNCVTMVNETAFRDNSSQWEAWKKDKTGYNTWLQEKITSRPERSHGFRYRGQYKEQVPEMLEIAKQG